jgi:3-oxoacyl-[acyl-carrier protein] reductase
MPPAQLPLAGRVAVVTGASRRIGIGFAVASRLAELGADLVVHGYSPHDADQPWGADAEGAGALAEVVAGHGRALERIDADLSDPSAPARLLDAAVERFGHVDIVVANHARSGHGSLDTVTSDELDAHWAVNARASILLAQAFAAQHDDARPGGRIVLFTSGQHTGGMPTELAYAVSKGAIHQATATLAAHLAPRGITVNTVNPGPTDTGWASAETDEAVRQVMPQGRWGRPSDAASLVGWLCTDEAAWITGQVIDSDGGFSVS